MTRRRMYLFERAYVDYWARLRSFGAALLRQCGAIWAWFWSGPGAAVIGVLLRLAVVVTGVTLAVLYGLYERDQGRSFTSFSTFAVGCVIALFVGLLLWGWKAPLDVLSRAASGASAAGLVAAVALAAVLVASVAFSLYLLALFALTALSFLVFLPMRAGQEIWLLYRRVAYHCPNDECPYKGLPVHVCSCGHRYPDLLPSFYGLFHHTCRHADGEVKLPTLDLLGRNKLPRLCGYCQRPLIHSSLGELEVRPVVVVGGPGAGKTVLLRQAVAGLRDALTALPGGKVGVDSAEQERDIQRDLDRLGRGQVLPATAGDVMQALGLAVRLSKPKRLRCLLHLFDFPGEQFASVRRFGRKQALQHVSGIVLLVDPFALGAVREHYGRTGRQAGAASMPFQELVNVLIAGVEQLQGRRAGKSPVPVAVVLSKADALPVADFPFLANLCPAPGRPADERLGLRCQKALEQVGEGNALRLLHLRFATVRYFACTALGRAPDPRNPRPFQAAGVLDPFLWLLGLDPRIVGQPAPAKAVPAPAPKKG